MTRTTEQLLAPRRSIGALTAIGIGMLYVGASVLGMQESDHDEHDGHDHAAESLPQPRSDQPAPPTGMTLDDALSANNGSLAVKVIQGSEYGGDVGHSAIQVHLTHRGQVVKTIDAEVDEHGVVVLEELPIAMNIQPVVTVHYADVQYQGVGELLSPQNPSGMVEVTVYDTTDEEPEWHIAMRHVNMHPMPDESLLWVSETVVVSNPATMTWLGKQMLPDDEKKAAARFNIPSSASRIELARGFHGWCCTKLIEETGEMQVQMPLMPGNNQYTFSYVVPVEDEAASMALTAPVRTANMMAMLPDDGSALACDSLQLATTESMGQSRVRIFQGTNLAASTPINLAITGVPAAAGGTVAMTGAPTGSALQTQGSAGALGTVKTMTLIGVGILVLFGIIVIVFRAGGEDDAATSGPGSESTVS